VTLDLRLIRQAQTLAAHGSFSRAAEALGIAQPTLSRSIRGLEDELGLALFSRHSHGVEPTDFGYVFLRQAALVVAQVNDLEREVALAKGLGTGELAVGFGPYPAELLVPACLRSFAGAHPAVRLRIQVDALEPLGRALRARALDMVVGEATLLADDDAICIDERLAPVQGCLLGRTRHPLAALPAPTMADALDYPLVQIARLPPRILKPFLSARRVRSRGATLPFPAIECPTVPLGLAAVEGSDALMLASLGMARRELDADRIVPVLNEPWMSTDWAVMRLRTRTPGPAAIAFVRALRDAHAQALAEDETLRRRWLRQPAGRRPTTGRSAGNSLAGSPSPRRGAGG